MNNRLTLQDIAELLAERTGKDKQEAELFLKELVAQIREGVYSDKMAKVKGVGTFKIILVDQRESVHVHTGERFLIPAHYKFSFLPDKELRDLVNKPFSFFETTELGENVCFSDLEESEETEDKEADPEDESVVEVMPDELLPPSEPARQTPDAPLELSSEISGQSSFPQPEPKSGDDPDKETPPDEQDKKNKQAAASFRKKTVLAFALLMCGIGTAYLYVNRFFLRNLLFGVEVVYPSPDSLAAASPPLVSDTLAVDTAAMAPVPPPPEKPAPKILATVRIEPGSRLTLISLEYYGSKLFWVYLYEYNKARVLDPNSIPVGTLIEVPAPELYGIDAHDKASIAKAAARQTEILSGGD